MPEHHKIDLIELPVGSGEELSTATAFFAEVFGWTYTTYGPDYADTTDSGTSSGVNADRTSTMPLTVIYSDDLEATKQAVVEHGGTVIVDTYEFPGGRRFHFTAPGGSELAVWSR